MVSAATLTSAIGTVSAVRRSEIMLRVRSRGTRPEMAIRRLVHGLSYRCRLHGKGLPGRPDPVFASRRKVIFVHGCYWYRHPSCGIARTPKSWVQFWRAKLDWNRERDFANQSELRHMGCLFLVVWECEFHDFKSVAKRVVSFLEDRHEVG